MKITVIGDSISLGGWVEDLRKFYDIENLSVFGATTENFLGLTNVGDVVILALGTNDSCLVDGYLCVEENRFEKNYRKLIKVSDNVIVLGILNVVEGSVHENQNKALYNEIVKRLAYEYGLIFVDVHGLLNEDDFVDGLHPNSSGNEKIFCKVKQVLDKLQNI